MVRDARTAILNADVVGPCRLMASHRHDRTTQLVHDRVERLAPAVERHGGRLVSRTRSGARAEFANAADALGAAIEFQQAMADANFGQSKDNAVLFRLGLHLGQAEERAWQDAHGQARAGGIVVSAPLHAAVAGRVKASFAELGRAGLGTVERPVHAYEVGWDPADWPAEAAAAAMPVTGRGEGARLGHWVSALAWGLVLVIFVCFGLSPRPQPRTVAEVDGFNRTAHEQSAEAAVMRWPHFRGEPDEPDDSQPMAGATSPPDAFDGAYGATVAMRPDGRLVTFKLKVTEGRGAGTQSRLDCGTAPIVLRISPDGDVSGMVLMFGATCLKTELAVRGRAVGGVLQLRIGSQYLELAKPED